MNLNEIQQAITNTLDQAGLEEAIELASTISLSDDLNPESMGVFLKEKQINAIVQDEESLRWFLENNKDYKIPKAWDMSLNASKTCVDVDIFCRLISKNEVCNNIKGNGVFTRSYVIASMQEKLPSEISFYNFLWSGAEDNRVCAAQATLWRDKTNDFEIRGFEAKKNFCNQKIKLYCYIVTLDVYTELKSRKFDK
jgi:hypothetical protein